MIVSELIIKLSKINQNLPIIIFDHCGNGQGFAENLEVINVIPQEGPAFNALKISVKD
jgi:hypothetical protein